MQENIVRHLKTDPNTWSLAELEGQQEMHIQALRELTDQQLAEMENGDQLKAENDALRKEYQAKLVATGRMDNTQAGFITDYISSAAVANAARGGISVKDFYDRYLSGAVTRDGMEGEGLLNQTAVPEAYAADPITRLWAQIGGHEEAYRYARSDKNTLAEILAEGDRVMNVTPESQELAEAMGADTALRVETDTGKTGYVYEKDGKVWVDVSTIGENEDGSRLYNAVGNYAANTGKQFIGDPEGLSDVAMSRRLENMISSAIKYGTTAHLAPHERQLEGGAGVSPIAWTEGAHADNLRGMITASIDATLAQVPELAHVRYNVETGKFEDERDGSEWDDDRFHDLANDARGGSTGGSGSGQGVTAAAGGTAPVTAGVRTLKRAALGHTLLSTPVGERPVFLDNLSAKLRESLPGNVAGLLYQFAGKNAQTADTHALNSAQQRLEAGEDAETVRKETGWYRGADGKWRFEISDKDAKLKKPFPSQGQAWGDILDSQRKKPGFFDKPATLGDLIDHPALFAAYPELANLNMTDEAGNGASFRPADAARGPAEIAIGRDVVMSDVLSIVMHEVQHAIQTKEGFARGGNSSDKSLPSTDALIDEINHEYREKIKAVEASPEYQQFLADHIARVPDTDRYREVRGQMLDVAKRDAVQAAHDQFIQPLLAERSEKTAAISQDGFDALKTLAGPRYAAYRRLAGEVEARNTQARQNMSEAERQATPPSQTADVADSDVIVMFNGKEMHSAPAPANAAPAQTPEQQQFAETEQAYGGEAAYNQAKAEGKTKLNYRQWVQVRTPAFKEWFGDWEGDPANASKVVDPETGEPLVVYHGTMNDFSEFSPESKGAATKAASARRGFFFADNSVVANFYTRGKPLPSAQEKADRATLAEPPDSGRTPRGTAIYSDEQKSRRQAAQKRLHDAAVKKLIAEDEVRKAQERWREYADEMWSRYEMGASHAVEWLANNPEERQTDPEFAELADRIEKARQHLLETQMDAAGMHVGGQVLPVFLSIRNPITHDFMGETYRDVTYNDLLKEVGNEKDGAIFERTYDSGPQPPGRPRKNEMTTVFVATDPTQIKSAIGNTGAFDGRDPNILKQGESQTNGEILGTFDPATLAIALGKNANLSTFLHESGHLFLEMMTDLATLNTAQQGLRDDVDAVMQWFGIAGDTAAERAATWRGMTLEQKRDYHEQFAESFEQYLMEGKAPSLELRPAFRAFRQWLTYVYKSLQNFLGSNSNAKLNNDLRAVFDRMLATEAQIKAVELASGMAPLFETRPPNMSEAEWEDYQQKLQDVADSAIEQFSARAMRDMKWLGNATNRHIKALQRQAKAARAQAQMEARRRVLSQPIYRAWQFLTAPVEGGEAANKRARSNPNVDPSRDSLFTAIAKLGGLNKAEAESQYGIDPKDYHQKSKVFSKPVLRVEGGLSPDAMAEALSQHGYMPLDDHGKWDIQDLDDMLRAEASGSPVYSNQADYDLLLGTPVVGMTPDAENVDYQGGRLHRDLVREMFDDVDLQEMQAGAGDTGEGGKLHQRSQATQATYEARIEALFSGDKPSATGGVKVLDRADILDLLGYGDMPLVLNEKHAIDDGKYNHPLTADQWKQIPEWLENPVAVFKRDDGHLTVITPALVNGKPLIIGIAPNENLTGGRTGGSTHLLLTAYVKDRGALPVKRMMEDGNLLFVDTRKSPGFNSGSGLQLPSSGTDLRGLGKSIKTGADLFKYRQENGGLLNQRAWHGSPHRGIEKTGFKLNRMGTGEGAQAFGWGMYFAGRREVADGYRKALQFNDNAAQDEAMEAIERADNDTEQAARNLETQADNIRGKARRGELSESSLDRADMLNAAAQWIKDGMPRENPGQLYSAEIPEDSDLLDFDKPLSEQPEKVQEAFRRALADESVAQEIADYQANMRHDPFGNNPTGRDLYGTLAEFAGGEQEASELLASYGLPGLRYLDGDSRAQNKVVWANEGAKQQYDSLAEGVARNYLESSKGDVETAIEKLERDHKASGAKQYGDAATALRSGDLALDNSHNYVIWDEALLTPEAAEIQTYYQKGKAADKAASPFGKLEPFLSDTGLDPDSVAALFGVDSAEQMIRDLMAAPDPLTAINQLTDEIMMARHSELATPEAIHQAAVEAVHSEARARLLATEMTIMEKGLGKPSAIVKQAKEYAKQIVGATKIMDLRPARYEASEAKAAKETARQLKKGNTKEALLQKRNQVLHNATVREIIAAKQKVEKDLAYLAKLEKAARSGKLRADVGEQVIALLARFDLRKSTSNRDAALMERSLSEFMQQQAGELNMPMPSLADKVANGYYRQSYKTMTVDEFAGVIEAAKALDAIGRREYKMFKAIRNQTFKEERAAVLERMREFWPEAFDEEGVPHPTPNNILKTTADNLAKKAKRTEAELVVPETAISILEGGEFGAIHESLFLRLSQQSDVRALKMKELTDYLKPFFDQYSLKERRDMGKKDIGTKAIGERLSRENAIVVALLAIRPVHQAASGSMPIGWRSMRAAKSQA